MLHTRRGLANALGVLGADAVLLLTMLIGLLRHAHKHPSGIWKLLYQQVIFYVQLARSVEFLLVHNLVSVGLLCRDTTCGWPILHHFSYIRLIALQVFLILNLNGVFFFFPVFLSHARAWTEADNLLCDLIEVWNQVWLLFFRFF